MFLSNTTWSTKTILDELITVFQALKVSDHYPVEVELKSLNAKTQEVDGKAAQL